MVSRIRTKCNQRLNQKKRNPPAQRSRHSRFRTRSPEIPCEIASARAAVYSPRSRVCSSFSLTVRRARETKRNGPRGVAAVGAPPVKTLSTVAIAGDESNSVRGGASQIVSRFRMHSQRYNTKKLTCQRIRWRRLDWRDAAPRRGGAAQRVHRTPPKASSIALRDRAHARGKRGAREAFRTR